ncbi:MAG: hypothetical protein ABI947_07770 [Chloroflexota bacterium]
MKRRNDPARPTVWLIPEDLTGYYVFEAIFREKQLNTHLELRGRAEGVAKLAKEVEGLIETLLREKSPTDCIIILHDTDESVQENRKSYLEIERICDKEKYRAHVIRIEVVQEIEAWLLADTKLCQWLEKSPKASDHIPQPSKVFEAHLNKQKHMKWNNLNKSKVLKNMDATGDQPGRSQSMSAAMQTLLQLPCVQSP